jgi:lysophospholipase L1-like esterase
MKYSKILLIILCAFIFPIVSRSQQVAWDSTVRPGNFALKTAQFRSYPDSKKDIVFLGNSITAGIDWHELLGKPYARNRGISGDITFGVLERLHEVTEGRPAKVFILIGINDIQRNIPDSVIVNNYKRMISLIKQESPKTKIYFQTLMPVNNEFTQFRNHYNKDEHIHWVNEQIRSFSTIEKVTVIDLHPHFLGQDGKLDKRYTMDGLHLNEAGYKVWASVLQNGNYLR